jgi:predicted CXXCH cytochrome family protein
MFWVMGPDRVYRLFPFVWLVEERRFVPEGHSFLQPPGGYAPNTSRWDEICIHCHATGGQPGLGGTAPAPRVGELGIACEACHGPAQEHVAANRNPLRRYWLHLRGAPDPTIRNPGTLPAKLSAAVCGQCHSYHDNRADPVRGHAFRPGASLEPTFRVVRFDTTSHAREADHFFWQDGTMRVTGREYNGLLETGCFTRGEMSCVSCHSIHESDPNDQLAAAKLGDRACLECHADYGARIEEHTHHPRGSSGAECMNCHMPHTTYGLLGAMRSHRIDSPSARQSAELGRPNACNLCHLGESLGWAADRLSEWYGQPPVALSAEQRELSAGVLWLLRGDAAQRGIAAWNMGWQASRGASTGDWQTLFLALTLDDPYPAVRSIAGDALRRFDGFGSFEYDYVPMPRRQGEAVARALRSAGRVETPREAGLQPLFDAEGRLDRERVDRLRAERDDRRVMISE